MNIYCSGGGLCFCLLLNQQAFQKENITSGNCAELSELYAKTNKKNLTDLFGFKKVITALCLAKLLKVLIARILSHAE